MLRYLFVQSIVTVLMFHLRGDSHGIPDDRNIILVDVLGDDPLEHGLHQTEVSLMCSFDKHVNLDPEPAFI